MQIRKNLSLIVGLSVPVLMIIFVAGSIYLPGLFIKPQHNFLYVSPQDYYSRDIYTVSDDKLIKNPNSRELLNLNTSGESKLYIHDVNTNKSREIAFEEAQKLNLDSSITSPDGFEVINGRSNDDVFGLFFDGSRDYNTYYLKGHNANKKLDLRLTGTYYYSNFKFLGWIK